MHTSKRPGIFCNGSHYLSYNRVKENENAIKNLTQVVFHVWPMCHVMCHILTHKMTLLFLVLQVIIKKFCIIVSTKHYQAKTDFFLPYHEGKKACVPDLKRGKDTTDQSAVLSSRAG